MKRATFSDIVQILEIELNKEEADEYEELSKQYASMRELMEDPVTQLKRSSTFTRQSLQQLNKLSPDDIENKVSPGMPTPEKNTKPSYMRAVATHTPQVLGQIQASNDTPSVVHLDKTNDIGDTIEYVAFQNNSDLSGKDIVQLNNEQGGYVAFEKITPAPKEGEDQQLFVFSDSTESTSDLNKPAPEGENLCAAYVTIEHALETANS